MVTMGRNKATRQGAQESAAASSTQQPQASQATITSAVAADPKLPPTVAAKRLFPLPGAARRGVLRFKIKEQLEEGRGHTWNWHNGATHANNQKPEEEELESIRKRFGYKDEKDGGPSKLYLMMLADALLPLPRNPMSGVVSPPLLATTGIVPCSIFSTGPDIIEHYCDCIVAAKREVILLTNYWQGGKNVDRIADALRELDKRVQQRNEAGQTGPQTDVPVGTSTAKVPNSDRIVVKVMWDRGPQTLADLFRCRKPVPPNMWKSNGLPTADEIPNLDMEILNYHRPLMGTFHAKLLLVDRQVALINSNNIQDRPNVEACTRLEGDIVNSIYDHALISWGNALNPPLPCLSTPAPKEPSPSAFVQDDQGGNLPAMSEEKLRLLARQARRRLHEEDEETEEAGQSHGIGSPSRRMSFADVVDGMMKQHAERTGGAPFLGGRRASADAQAAAALKSSHQASGTTAVDSEKAARAAGVTWATKVLGDRRQQATTPGQEHVPAAGKTAPVAAAPGLAEQRSTDAGPPSAPPSPGSPGASGAQMHNRRHLADYVEAVMKKEGIKPGLWAEGALDTLGLGPSSSRNVADEVRRSRETKRQATASSNRNVSVPRAVKEEGVDSSDRSQTIVDGDEYEPGQQRADEGHLARKQEERDAGQAAATREPMSAKPVVADPSEGAPGSVGYRRQHRRTLSNLSRTSASQRLAQITKSLDFANLSQVKGEIKADQLFRFSRSAAPASTPAAEAPVEAASRQGAPVQRTAAVPTVAEVSTETAEAEPISRRASRPDESELRASSPQMKAFAEGAHDVLDFRPYVFHAPHEPVPMALVNRRPHGTPGHSDIRNPQDAAWLAGFRYAQHHIFIQSPTLNASPIIAAVLSAVRRHVRVELWLDLGFNDKSESMPFQGGTNEQVVTRLFRQLRREGKGDEKYLEVYWYTGKDMTRPLNAVRKQRNCHVKYAAFDGQVAILGSGNQDTQSWFHSQEINVCVDSKQIVAEWDHALRRNQSTGVYGRVDDDGIWRGRSGSEVVDTGKDPKKGADGGVEGRSRASSRSTSESPSKKGEPAKGAVEPSEKPAAPSAPAPETAEVSPAAVAAPPLTVGDPEKAPDVAAGSPSPSPIADAVEIGQEQPPPPQQQGRPQ
ncbi:unnamed protein product [Parajaminaea phylloscopi]